MAGQLLDGNSCRTGTSHCRQPSQWASSRIIPTKLQMRRNLLAIARNCSRKYKFVEHQFANYDCELRRYTEYSKQ